MAHALEVCMFLTDEGSEGIGYRCSPRDFILVVKQGQPVPLEALRHSTLVGQPADYDTLKAKAKRYDRDHEDDRYDPMG